MTINNDTTSRAVANFHTKVNGIPWFNFMGYLLLCNIIVVHDVV